MLAVEKNLQPLPGATGATRKRPFFSVRFLDPKRGHKRRRCTMHLRLLWPRFASRKWTHFWARPYSIGRPLGAEASCTWACPPELAGVPAGVGECLTRSAGVLGQSARVLGWSACVLDCRSAGVPPRTAGVPGQGALSVGPEGWSARLVCRVMGQNTRVP